MHGNCLKAIIFIIISVWSFIYGYRRFSDCRIYSYKNQVTRVWIAYVVQCICSTDWWGLPILYKYFSSISPECSPYLCYSNMWTIDYKIWTNVILTLLERSELFCLCWTLDWLLSCPCTRPCRYDLQDSLWSIHFIELFKSYALLQRKETNDCFAHLFLTICIWLKIILMHGVFIYYLMVLFCDLPCHLIAFN